MLSPWLWQLAVSEGSSACSSAAEEDVAFAASCAAFFSKARNEGKVPVAKAFVSDLSKPTGAAPGKACPATFLFLLNAHPARAPLNSCSVSDSCHEWGIK